MIAEVDGYSAANPVPDDDWEDFVRWELRTRERARQEKHGHNLDGWFAHPAGSPQCLALGHVAPDWGWENDPHEEHREGFDGDMLCLGTIYGACCTECEGECSADVEDEVTQDDLWQLPGVRGRAEC